MYPPIAPLGAKEEQLLLAEETKLPAMFGKRMRLALSAPNTMVVMWETQWSNWCRKEFNRAFVQHGDAFIHSMQEATIIVDPSALSALSYNLNLDIRDRQLATVVDQNYKWAYAIAAKIAREDHDVHFRQMDMRWTGWLCCARRLQIRLTFSLSDTP
jgi:hypothetical protein